MKGLGTDDDRLCRVIVSRCEVDMVQIKEEFQKQYPLRGFLTYFCLFMLKLTKIDKPFITYQESDIVFRLESPSWWP